MLFSWYGLYLPLNRQSAAYAREGIDLDVSTLADWVGAGAAILMPLIEVVPATYFLIRRVLMPVRNEAPIRPVNLQSINRGAVFTGRIGHAWTSAKTQTARVKDTFVQKT